MMKVVKFFVAGNPVTQGSMRAFMPKGAKFPVVTHEKGPELKQWRAMVAGAAFDAFGVDNIHHGPLRVSVVFYLQRPQSHYGRHGLLPSAPAYPIKKPDLDKLERAIGDALKGVIYVDDSQVIDWHVVKRFGERPGAMIRARLI